MGRSLKDATGNTTTAPTPVTPDTTYRRPHYQKQLLFRTEVSAFFSSNLVASSFQILRQLLQMEPPIGHTLLGVLQIEMIQISLVFGPFQQLLPLGTILSVDGA